MEEKSREIGEAARQYVASRWRFSGRAVGAPSLMTVGAVLVLLSTVVGRLDRPNAKTWQIALLVISVICFVSGGRRWLKRLAPGRRDRAEAEERAGEPRWWFWPVTSVIGWGAMFGVMWLALRPAMRSSPSALLMILTASLVCALLSVWIMRRWLQGDWRRFARERMLKIQQDAGVVVEEPSVQEPNWWFWPFAFVAGPAFFLGALALSLSAPVQLQPLVFAGGVTVFATILWMVARAAVDRRVRSQWHPWHFLGWGLYWCYALAVAAGLPQPFTHVAAPWVGVAWTARLAIPLTVVMTVHIIASEIYSRRQFRRLQRLVNEEPDGTD